MRRSAATIILAAAAVAPAAAHADGLPVPVDAARHGIQGADGSTYVTRRAGRDTRVVRFAARRTSLRLDGRFVVPVVALDGTVGGLSHDGSTLALITPRKRFPRSRTTLALIDAKPLRVRRVVRLNGDFSFDALSPDGRRVFLVEYTSRRDPTRYAVRALDVKTGLLEPNPIVDPDEEPGEMRGYPLARVPSADGRWEYTLYDGGGEAPFIHALDTTGLRAHCIDLPDLPEIADAYELRLTTSGDLRLRGEADPRGFVIDTETFAVRRPGSRAPERRAPEDTMAVWPAVGGATVLLVALALVRRRRQLRRLISA